MHTILYNIAGKTLSDVRSEVRAVDWFSHHSLLCVDRHRVRGTTLDEIERFRGYFKNVLLSRLH